ncbi:hypothetical protein EV196_101257 [Mariniflexile fucanivorans]|uniref:Nitrite reductase/ring-hydroxylating ferredoxin subunit n=1 Tax=Mariniflexile fucanivorans TaxID=264023 RepID=A0A4R1RR83_9FLAO|nr:hypothetical protein [Mariniflexile fucanivorans]TCL68834.1 hypothetical protein EV196_101257 [Mariniflexile fucanivorans]
MKSLKYIFCFTFLVACSGNTENENCKFLLDINVNTSINLSLPQYSQLQFDTQSIYIPNFGNGGIIVTNAVTNYLAWDASDPNHAPSSGCHLEISGLEATCSCGDGNTYSLINGQPLNGSTLVCGLKNYRIDKSGNNLLISNY